MSLKFKLKLNSVRKGIVSGMEYFQQNYIICMGKVFGNEKKNTYSIHS